MGAALLRHALAAEPEPLRSIPILSAGVSARSGAPMTDYSVAALKKVGIAAGSHTSRPLTQELLDGAILVLCMTDSHKATIQAIADPEPKNLYLFRELMKNPKYLDIADPYGGPFPAYETSRDEMVEAVPSIVQFLKTQIR
jgi:protein-tyrosine-phosphatase